LEEPALFDAEHVELAFVPADNDVHSDAAFADMVGGDEFLGRYQRMKQRGVDRAENGHALSGAEKSDSPSDCFERTPVKIRATAVALPARDRQHEIETSIVGQLRQRETVGPACRPALRDFGGRAARRAIGAEQSDLERVAIVHGDAVLHGCAARQHGILPGIRLLKKLHEPADIPRYGRCVSLHRLDDLYARN